MDIHKPKPVHSWREFLTEIGTIVIGVMIALAAEQIVDAMRWRHEVAEARAVIAGEIASNIEGSIDIMRGNDCTERRLDQVEAMLTIAARTGALPPLGEINQPPARLMTHGAWDSFVASQAASHLDHSELADLGNHYSYVEQSALIQQKMVDAWNALMALVGPGRPIDAREATALQANVTQARGLNRELALLNLRMVDVSTQNITFNAADAADIKAEFHADLNLPICGPIGPVPATYGRGLGASTIGLVDARLKSPPNLKISH